VPSEIQMQLPIRHTFRHPLMLLIRHHILQRPFHPFLESMFAHGAILFCTNGTLKIHAGIRMDEELDGLAELFADERCQHIDLRMRLHEIEVPGQGEVTVDMQQPTVLDHPQVMQVYPVLAAVVVEIGHHVAEQLHIRLVHDAGDGAAQDAIARIDDDACEDEGDDGIQDDEFGIPDDDQSDDDARGGVSVGLEVPAAGLQGHRAVLFAFVDADGPYDIVDEGRESHQVDALVEFQDDVGPDKIHDGLVDDDEPRHDDQRAFDGGREEFSFTVTVRVVFVAGLGCYVEAIQPDEACDDVHRAFQCVGKHGDGLGKIIGCQLHKEEDDRDGSDPLLQPDIFFSFFQGVYRKV